MNNKPRHGNCKLDDHDKYLVGRLKADRNYHLSEADKLKDEIIAAKFGVSKSMIKTIPAWSE